MSGIAGIIHFDGRPVDAGQIRGMTAAMDYRGPDGINHWVQGPVALGQCMLRTTPESLEETQPLTNEDGSLVLVMDGRIDNWEELRHELLAHGAHLRSRADAELVMRAFEQWGMRCLDHIEGDFALAVWNANEQSLWCARDHIGAKPFFYHASEDRFLFASEPAAFRNVEGVSLTADLATIAEYVANDWVSNTATFWKEIVRLPRATAMCVNRGGIRQQTHWEPSLHQVEGRSRDDYVEEYLATISDVSRRSMRSHRPLAFEVSGGLDSSALFALADRLERDGALPAPGLHGLTLDFHGDSQANELAYVEAVSRHLRRVVTRVTPTVHTVSEYRDLATQTLDFPGYPNGVMAFGIRKRAYALGCRAIFSGVGGDEWLGMLYDGLYITEEMAAGNIGHVWDSFRADARQVGPRGALRRLLHHGLYRNLPEHVRIPLRWVAGRGNSSRRPRFVDGDLLQALELRRLETKSPTAPEGATVGQRLLWKVLHASYDARSRESEERIAAIHGLDLRRIFHDRRIIQLAFATPERFRSQQGMTKLIHRNAMKNLLPDAITLRPDKADFMLAFSQTLASVGRAHIQAIRQRRSDWLSQAPMLAADLEYWDGPSGAQKDEWRIWSLLGCDVLLQSQFQ